MMQRPGRRFDDKVVLITGASAGIGGAAARGFAAEGAKVVLAARGIEALERVGEAIGEGGGEALVLPTDVGDAAACEALIEATLERYGGLDVLVNNAGMHLRGDFDQHPPSGFGAMVDVNLRAPVLLTGLALPSLRARRGAIVNVASIAGFVPLPGAAVYSATKAGLRAFSRALADELADGGVRVTLVSPGPVETGFILDELETVSPLALSQPMSSAEQVAELVLDAAAEGAGAVELALPRISAALATISYVLPAVGRAVRPLLRRRGERAREALRRKLGLGR
jgi:short-subunit dehydrogenase